jgi:transcriptional regulator with XRE-family HTH domain
MEIEKLASELVRALRGKRSQLAFSRRLGYQSNVVGTWEAGRRWPDASEALRAASVAGVDLRAAFARYYRTPPAWVVEVEPTSPVFVARFLEAERGRTPVTTVAARASLNRFSVSRWLAGSCEPRLPDFLRLVDATSLRLADFLAALVDPSEMPSLAADWERREAQRSLAIEQPWSQAVLRLLELPDRPGDLDGIAARLGLDRTTTRRCLQGLERTGQAARTGGGWHATGVSSLDTRRDEATARRLKFFWADVAGERFQAGAAGGMAFNVVGVSLDQLARIDALRAAYFNAVRTIVAEEVQPECVALLTMGTVRLDASDAGGVAGGCPPAPRRRRRAGYRIASPS